MPGVTAVATFPLLLPKQQIQHLFIFHTKQFKFLSGISSVINSANGSALVEQTELDPFR